MYHDVIEALGEMIEAHVLLSPKVRLEESAADILARAPGAFALVGASYGGSLAMEVALAALTMPALILWGEKDPLMPVALGRALADALPHAHFHFLPSCGHLPTLEKPAECAALIGSFLHDKLQLK